MSPRFKDIKKPNVLHHPVQAKNLHFNASMFGVHIGMIRVKKELCYMYKGTKFSFSYNSFVKFHGIKNGSHNMTMLYPNP